MKAERLEQLQRNYIYVPKFIVISNKDIAESELDLSFSTSDKFAVRSSSDTEDDLGESHAGEFKTLLNIKRENVYSAIKEVFSSYNKSNTSGKVIVQEMIDSDLSGVIFTANPIGILNEFVIVIGNGLGNGIVDNQVPVTTYHYNLDDKTYIVEYQDNSPVLDKNGGGILYCLISIGKHIEEILGFKADIEFAIKENEISILQARPITTLCNEAEIVLDNSNIVESYTGAVTPLTYSFVHDCYYRIFKNLLLRMTNNKQLVNQFEPVLQDMIDIVDGRLYYRISNWYQVLRLLPFSNRIIKIWQDMLGVRNRSISGKAIKIGLLTKCKVFLDFIKFLVITPLEMNKINSSFESRLSKYRADCKKAKAIIQLHNLYLESKKNILASWDITLINDMYTFINTWLAGKHNKDSISDVGQLESMKPIQAFETLASKYEQPNYEEYKREYIDKYGDRVLGELKLETETFRTNESLLDSLVQQRKNDGYNERVKGGQSGESCASKKSFNIFVRNAKIGIRNREISRLNRSKLYGLAREILFKIGEILCNQCKIEDKLDILYLYDYEILDCCDSRDSSIYKKLIAQRKREYRENLAKKSFNRLVFDREVLHNLSYTLGDNSSACLNAAYNHDNIICGSGISSGKVTGKVVVIDTPDTNIDTTGKIIVTRYTDPGWVFLIRNSLGIVTEQGSLLSHTAIISRELRKPAVTNIPGIITILKNGDTISVDGLTGRIEIIATQDK